MQSTWKSSLLEWLVIPFLRLVNRLLVILLKEPPPPALPPSPPVSLLTPNEQELLDRAEQVLPLSPTSESMPVGQSCETSDESLNRTHMVMALLDEAYAQGLSTYPQLIQYVTEQTGQGCSRRAIARWKRERNLL